MLDEPFAGLDPLGVAALGAIVREEAARGAAVVFSSHQLDLVEDLCDDIAIIDHGRVVATGDLDTLRRASSRRRVELQLEGAAPPGSGGSAASSWSNAETAICGCLASQEVDPEQVLMEAEQAGRVIAFSYGPPTLAELFLELVAS